MGDIGGDEGDRLRQLRSLQGQGVRYAFGIASGEGPTPPDLGELDLCGVEVVDAITALEDVAADDQPLAIAGVARAMETGTARDELRMVDGTWATTHLFDLSATHGMLVGVVVTADRLHDLRQGDRAEVPPRVGQLTMDAQGRVLWANDNIRKLFGYSFADDPDRHVLTSIHPEDRHRNYATWAAMLATPADPHRTRYRRRHAEGHWVWCEATFVNHLSDPRDPRVDVEVLDISSEMAAHEAVRARERLLQRLAESLPDGVLQIDDHRTVVYANSRAHHLLGPDATLTGLVDRTVTEDRPALTAAIDAALGTGEDHEVEVHVRRAPRDEPAVYRVTLRAVADDGEDGSHPVSGALCCIADVTEQARRRSELEARASHDDLTDAYNRVATVQVLEAALADAGPGSGVAVVFVDLDDFKQVNDTHGHSVGDRLLQAVATRLLQAVRADDVVGRFGGDEFLVVCPGVGEIELAGDVVGRIERALAVPEVIGGITITPTASLGVACTFAATDAEQLIARADASMYASKRAQG